MNAPQAAFCRLREVPPPACNFAGSFAYYRPHLAATILIGFLPGR